MPYDEELEYHQCDRQDSWWEHDYQGIPLCRVCDDCRQAKLSRYRPEIIRGYSQEDVDEPIDEEDGYPVVFEIHLDSHE